MSLTPAELAAEIGCHVSAVRRAIRRLGIDRDRGAPIPARLARQLRQEITPGRGAAGGYPAGVRRHDQITDAELAELMQQVQQVVDQTAGQDDAWSWTKIAQALDVATRTLLRWRDGVDHPAPQRLRRLRAWLKKQQRPLRGSVASRRPTDGRVRRQAKSR